MKARPASELGTRLIADRRGSFDAGLGEDPARGIDALRHGRDDVISPEKQP